MAQARGYNSQLVIDFETTFGADPASPDGKAMPINSWDVSGARNLNSAQTLTGTRNPVEPFAGNKSLAGNAVVPVDLVAFAYWLKAMFGAPATTGAGPYVHVFKFGATQPSLVAEKKFDFSTAQTYMKQNGIKISTLGLTVGGDGELVANLGIVGSSESAPGTTRYDLTPTTVTLDRLNNFQAAIKEGGSAIATVTEVAINLNFGLETDKYVIGGGGVLGEIPEGIVAVEGTLTALFADTSLLTKAANLTESALAITLTKGTHSLKIEIHELVYELKTPGITGPAGVMQQLGFKGYYANSTAASAAVVTLTNAVASYA